MLNVAFLHRADEYGHASSCKELLNAQEQLLHWGSRANNLAPDDNIVVIVEFIVVFPAHLRDYGFFHAVFLTIPTGILNNLLDVVTEETVATTCEFQH